MNDKQLVERLEALIEAFHDALPQGQGETGDNGEAGKALCQWVYDNAPDLAATIRDLQAKLDEAREGLREARLQLEYLDDKWPTGTTLAVLGKVRTTLARIGG